MTRTIHQLFDLSGRTALVTGGSRGIGKMIVEGFLAAGAARVYISARKAEQIAETVAELGDRVIAMLGNGGLARFERGIAELEGVPEAGWALAASAWGKGLATEAMSAVLAWADQTGTIPEVRCIIDPDNAASKAVARKIGFTQFASTQDPLGPVDVFRRAFARTIS